MLVLNRRIGESIVIDRDVRVVVLAVRGNSARLGIEAPRDVPVHRHEVAKTIWGPIEIGGKQ